MKSLLWIVMFALSASLWASDKLSVRVEPQRPIVNETFSVIFKVNSESAQRIDQIDFKYPGLTIVGQSQQGVSTKTIYENGKLTVSRDLTVVYELQANNFGTKFLRDIRVKVDGKEITHPMVSFEVIKEPQVAPDVFVMADVPKTDLFVGEGIVVRYYLYSKVSVTNLDVKKYPQLNNFLKRYLQEPDRSERVTVDGQLYIRNLIYAAKLFPEKPGPLKIDPLSLSVTYARINSNDPFNVFSSARDMRTKSISSEIVKLNVLPWPKPMPENFSGLVGKHDFSLNMSQSKLVVNQPLEVSLTVSGPGALENYEAPKIIESSSLEEFESNGELKIQDTNFASKIFTYTFLASSPVEIPSKKITFSYLNPETGKYEEVEVERPSLQIGGQARSESKREKNDSTQSKTESSVKDGSVSETLSLQGLTTGSSWRQWLDQVNVALVVIILIILVSFSFTRLAPLRNKTAVVPSHFKKEFLYHEFIQWLSPIMIKEAKSPKEVLRESGLSPEAVNYFEDLMNNCEVSKFSSNKKGYNYSFRAKYFKELAALLEKYNESHS